VFTSTETSIDHNQYIIGDYTYQSNYESGLRMLHINRDTHTLTQVAYFDVFPERTTAAFNGAWSVYPYFKSGNIAISSINHGLFMVTPDWSGINRLLESGETGERTRSLKSVAGAICDKISEKMPCSAPVEC